MSPGADQPNADLAKAVVEHHYFQHLLKGEVKRANEDYWNGRRKWVTATWASILAAAGIFGFQFNDLLNLKKGLTEAKAQVETLKAQAGQLEQQAKLAKGSADAASTAASGVEKSVQSIRQATEDSLSRSSALLESSLKHGQSAMDAAKQAFGSSKDAGQEYVAAAKAMLAPLQETEKRLNRLGTELTEKAERVDRSTETAQQAAAEAKRLRDEGEAYQQAVKQIATLQKQLAAAWTSETVAILAKDPKQEKNQNLARPKVRIRSPESGVEFEFTFQMKSPGNRLDLQADIKNVTSGMMEKKCLNESKSARVHGRYYALGSSPFFIRPDFVYQSLLADDFVILRVVAVVPDGAAPEPLRPCAAD